MCSALVRHEPTARYLAVGCTLTAQRDDALTFAAEADAHAFLDRHACEREAFIVLPVAAAQHVAA